jgi:ATP-binding cassette subfamily F protein uup
VRVLLVARGLEKAWGDRAILRGIDLTVGPREVVGLVGANGCGKSTLLQLLAGEVQADHGEVLREVGVGVLSQQPRLPPGTVYEAAAEALAWHRDLVTAWEAAVAAGDPAAVAPLQDRLDAVGWQLGHQVDALLDRLRCPPADASVDRLSGGEIRRVALVRALLASPDLLLLDEPTNHLDADTVEWLQAHLAGFAGGTVLVTHDRYLLEAVATRIVEIDDGVAVSYEGSYTDYLIERAERQASLRRSEDARLALIAQEAAWASRSPAARTTKQKARLQRLDALKEARPLKREETFHLDLRTGTKFGRTLLEARGLTKSFGPRTVLRSLDLDLAPGERLGVVGPNGAGKSTLLSLLTGALNPDQGTLSRAPRVQLAVLDQHRTGLDPHATVFEAAGDGNDHVIVGDEAVHVASFLRRFLFPREQLGHAVESLSGGERARLLLARLLLRGANLLFLDEPTNDLDLMTLRVLEEALLAFDGAAVVVTHDRAFLDRVCTGVLAFEGDGRTTRYADRAQWLAAHQAALRAERDRSARLSAPAPAVAAPAKPAVRVRLSFKEQRELDALPAAIEALEAEQASVETALADPGLWRTRPTEAQTMQARLAALTAEIEASYSRWTALDARSG